MRNFFLHKEFGFDCLILFFIASHAFGSNSNVIPHCNKWLTLSARFTNDYFIAASKYLHAAVRLDAKTSKSLPPFERCTFDNNDPLHIRFDRKLKMDSTLLIHQDVMQTMKGTIAVYVINEIASSGDNFQESQCSYDGKDFKINHESYYLWNCKMLEHSVFAADGVEIRSSEVSTLSTKVLRAGNDSIPWLIVKPWFRHERKLECPAPGVYADQNVEPFKESYNRSEKIVYSCKNQGFVISGEAKRQCNNLGRWTGAPPKCVDANLGSSNSIGKEQEEKSVKLGVCPPIDPYFGMPQGLFANNKSFRAGDDAIRDLIRKTPCSEGYQLVSMPIDLIQCGSGSWKGDSPMCEKIMCKSPPDVQNGHWKYPTDRQSYDKVYYSCDEGYSLYGNASIQCVHGEWSGSTHCVTEFDRLPFCDKVLDDSAVEFTHKYVAFEKNTGKKYAAIRIKDDAYEKLLAISKSCMFNSIHPLHLKLERKVDISEVFIRQEASSKIPQLILTDDVASDETRKAEYANQGLYEIFLSSPSKRLDYWHFIRNSPIGDVNNNADGITLTSPEISVFNLKLLDPSLPTPWLVFPVMVDHIYECKPPGKYPDQSVVPSKELYGKNYAEVTYACENPDSILVGSADRTCKWGKWSGVVPKCLSKVTDSQPNQNVAKYSSANNLQKECPPIDSYFGMPYELADYSLNFSINAYIRQSPCETGFALFHMPEINALHQCNSGTWNNGDSPICEIQHCKRPPTIENARWKYSRGVFDEAYYSCKDGYQPSESTGTTVFKVECTNDSWEALNLACEIIKCPTDPPSADNAQWRYTHQGLFHLVTYSCDEGYIIFSNESSTYVTSVNIECEEGIWIGEAPMCEKMSPISNITSNLVITYLHSPTVIQEETTSFEMISTETSNSSIRTSAHDNVMTLSVDEQISSTNGKKVEETVDDSTVLYIIITVSIAGAVAIVTLAFGLLIRRIRNRISLEASACEDPHKELDSYIHLAAPFGPFTTNSGSRTQQSYATNGTNNRRQQLGDENLSPSSQETIDLMTEVQQSR